MLAILFVVLASSACVTASPALDPDAGTITFGRSVDTTTSELRGKTSTFGVGDDVAFRAPFVRSTEDEPLRQRLTANGVVLFDDSSGELESGWTIYMGTIPGGNLYTPGDYYYELLDVGNNQLAAGVFKVTAK